MYFVHSGSTWDVAMHKISGKVDRMTALSDLLKTSIDNGTTVPEALTRMRKSGNPLDKAQVYRAVKGQHAKRPTERVLTGLSVGFKIPVTRLREAVNAPAGELGRYVPPREADRLNQRQRNALSELIRSIGEAGNGGVADTAQKSGITLEVHDDPDVLLDPVEETFRKSE